MESGQLQQLEGIDEIASLAKSIAYLVKEIARLHTMVEQQKEIVKDRLKQKGLKKLDVENLRVLNVERTTINYFPEKIEQKIHKSIANKFINRTYRINDYSGLIKLMQEFDVDPIRFKKFIEVDKEVDKQKLSNLFVIGEISIDELDGCYEVKYSNNIQVKERDNSPRKE